MLKNGRSPGVEDLATTTRRGRKKRAQRRNASGAASVCERRVPKERKAREEEAKRTGERKTKTYAGAMEEMRNNQ